MYPRRVRIITLLLATSLLFTPLGSEARRPRKPKTPKVVVDPAPVVAPKPNEVCFAPIEPCDIKLSKFIESATKTLDVAIFDLNLDQVAHQILVKSKTVKVRVVVDDRQAKSDHSLVSTLRKGGVDIRIGRQRGIMHNKFTIVDGARLETGSFNYTNGAAFKNNENQVYLDTPAIVSRYIQRFDQIWKEAKKLRAKED